VVRLLTEPGKFARVRVQTALMLLSERIQSTHPNC